jgi:hypothetical protein
VRASLQLVSISLLPLAILAAGCSSGPAARADAASGEAGRSAAPAGAPGASGAGGRGGSGGIAADAAAEQGATERDAEADAASDVDGPVVGACLGPCLEAFLLDCQKSLGCTSTVSGNQTDLCYPNGVRERQTDTAMGIRGTVKKADGTFCYAYTRTRDVQSYFDSAGHMTAELTAGVTEFFYTATCGADMAIFHVDLSLPACTERRAISKQTCTPGACSF